MTYTYKWPMAAPCSAILIYTRSGSELTLLTTHRAPAVGVGRCLSAGGFYEVKDMFNTVGKMQDGRAETYREMVEELGEEINTIIPYEVFAGRVRHLWDGMVTSHDPAIIYNGTFRTLEVSAAEMAAIMVLPPTEEQIGKTLEVFQIDSSTDDELIARRLADFKYGHEVEAAKMWYAQMARALG